MISRDRNVTRGKKEQRKKEIEKSIERYLQQLDTADRQDPATARTVKKAPLTNELTMLGKEMQR